MSPISLQPRVRNHKMLQLNVYNKCERLCENLSAQDNTYICKLSFFLIISLLRQELFSLSHVLQMIKPRNQTKKHMHMLFQCSEKRREVQVKLVRSLFFSSKSYVSFHILLHYSYILPPIIPCHTPTAQVFTTTQNLFR